MAHPRHRRDDPQFEWRIIADRELSTTSRLAWMLTTLSAERGYSFMCRAEMCRRLRTPERQLYISLARLIDIGLFRREQINVGGAIHTRYHPVLLPGETHRHFLHRVQDRPELEICTRLHWMAFVETRDRAAVEVTDNTLGWEVTSEAMRLARRKMERLGHFDVESGSRDRGTIYSRRCGEGDPDDDDPTNCPKSDSDSIDSNDDNKQFTLVNWRGGNRANAFYSSRRAGETPDYSRFGTSTCHNRGRCRTRPKSEQDTHHSKTRWTHRFHRRRDWNHTLWLEISALLGSSSVVRSSLQMARFHHGESIVRQALESIREFDYDPEVSDFLHECCLLSGNFTRYRGSRAA